MIRDAIFLALMVLTIVAWVYDEHGLAAWCDPDYDDYEDGDEDGHAIRP